MVKKSLLKQIYEKFTNSKSKNNIIFQELGLSWNRWRNRFLCPVCGKPGLDFIISHKIKEPFVCMCCHTFFVLKPITKTNLEVNKNVE